MVSKVWGESEEPWPSWPGACFGKGAFLVARRHGGEQGRRVASPPAGVGARPVPAGGWIRSRSTWGTAAQLGRHGRSRSLRASGPRRGPDCCLWWWTAGEGPGRSRGSSPPRAADLGLRSRLRPLSRLRPPDLSGFADQPAHKRPTMVHRPPDVGGLAGQPAHKRPTMVHRPPDLSGFAGQPAHKRPTMVHRPPDLSGFAGQPMQIDGGSVSQGVERWRRRSVVGRSARAGSAFPPPARREQTGCRLSRVRQPGMSSG